MTRSTINGLGQGLHGDETTTGAVCYSSLPHSTQGERGVLRVGDKTSDCPRCGQQGTIAEGWQGFIWNGAQTALHGARVRCGCPPGSNRLIALDPPQRSTRMANPGVAPAGARAAQSSSPTTFSSPAAPQSPFSTEQNNEPAEPGFYIVPKSTTRQQLIAELFGEAPSPEVMRKFNGLNGSLGDGIVKAGQMVVLGDPRNYMCMREEAHLMEAAEEVAVALADLEPDDADFMAEYQAQIAAILGSASTWGGVATAGMEKHLGDITRTLQNLEALYVDTYRTYGRLNVPEFFSKRKVILDELDGKLFNSARVRGALSLGNHPKLQKSLRISSKSVVHHWKKSGAAKELPGYTNYIKTMSKATIYMKHGGYLAIGIGGISSFLKIKEACEAGSTDTCRRVVITETTKFVASSAAGIAGAKIGAKESPYICYKFSLNPKKYGTCTIAVVAGSAYLGSTFATDLGEYLGGEAASAGDVIHDHFFHD
ncbi:PAAR domain-containing protein [Pseudomonas sp. 148P]|uniref:PAAR domain-containing protein n=1 Tax=Pseudomonas ulcerans TaxID=3115852 RepID=A0ABU7HNB6_9PSED|nr:MULTISPECIES: PAAR domain-containing protein [unclassified Pseudomonas]MEE1922524.1 PAAR domain-containing protein [Pseudomonas sp. 147P]MEE1932998.1 PAAR domain-containing protein [Pseudomonas sp. 148P]